MNHDRGQDESTVQGAVVDLSIDDRVLIRAIALVGDVMRERELERLLEQWAWGRPMTRARVGELEALGLLRRASDGWFVTREADALVGDELGAAVRSLLTACVGVIVCHEAETLDRFRLGLRRVLAAGDEGRVVELCRAWARTPGGQSGPRGGAFVEAVGLHRAPSALRARIAVAVPESRPRVVMLAWQAWQAVRARGISALFTLLVLTLALATARGRPTPATRPVRPAHARLNPGGTVESEFAVKSATLCRSHVVVTVPLHLARIPQRQGRPVSIREVSGESGIPAMVLTACALSAPHDSPDVARVAVHALAPSSVRAFQVAVTGDGITEPVTAHLVVDDDRAARGNLSVPSGAVRRIEIEAIGSNGEATHRGGVSMPLMPGGHAPVQVLLTRV